jgi:hypothetical protein
MFPSDSKQNFSNMILNKIKSNMIKLIIEITLTYFFKYRKSDSSPKKPLRISCKSVLIYRKTFQTFHEKFREKYMEFEENNSVRARADPFYI